MFVLKYHSDNLVNYFQMGVAAAINMWAAKTLVESDLGSFLRGTIGVYLISIIWVYLQGYT